MEDDLPSWTYLILISLYHVLRLCHSFKVWSLPPPLQFYHQRVFILNCLLNRGHPYPHLDMCPSPWRYVWSIPLRVHFSPLLFKVVLGVPYWPGFAKSSQNTHCLFSLHKYLQLYNLHWILFSGSTSCGSQSKTCTKPECVSRVRCLIGGIGITWESVRKKNHRPCPRPLVQNSANGVGNLSASDIESHSPALQADSLPSEPPWKPNSHVHKV